MNGQKLLEEVKHGRWERLKETIDEPDKITMTRNVFEELMREVSPYIIAHKAGNTEGKCTLFGMEIEVIDDADGCFSIGGKMKGVKF